MLSEKEYIEISRTFRDKLVRKLNFKSSFTFIIIFFNEITLYEV